MHCKSCNITKLSEEFPDDTLTEDCEHAPLHCLRCVTKCVVDKGKCSQCDITVNKDNENFTRFIGILEYMFPKSKRVIPKTSSQFDKDIDTASTIRVAMLSGDSTSLKFNPNLTIEAVREHVSNELNVPVNNQRLLLNGKELQNVREGAKRLAILNDYGIKPLDTLQLIVLLYELKTDLDHVIFDLFWGYPDSETKDALDASAFIFSGESLSKVMDYRNKNWECFQHSGDDLRDDSKREAHQTINISISKIPSDVTKIFFTLSAWSSPTISKFKQPSLRFFDARKPDQQLCNDTLSDAAESQAVIMSALCRVGKQSWVVYSLGELSAGNTENYDPLCSTIIDKIIKRGLV